MDRNLYVLLCGDRLTASLSARRAWIEIFCGQRVGVGSRSLSARRAWIEIPVVPAELTTLVKSLSARRAWIEIRHSRYCRYWSGSLSARRAWIEMVAKNDVSCY